MDASRTGATDDEYFPPLRRRTESDAESALSVWVQDLANRGRIELRYLAEKYIEEAARQVAASKTSHDDNAIMAAIAEASDRDRSGKDALAPLDGASSRSPRRPVVRRSRSLQRASEGMLTTSVGARLSDGNLVTRAAPPLPTPPPPAAARATPPTATAGRNKTASPRIAGVRREQKQSPPRSGRPPTTRSPRSSVSPPRTGRQTRSPRSSVSPRRGGLPASPDGALPRHGLTTQGSVRQRCTDDRPVAMRSKPASPMRVRSRSPRRSSAPGGRSVSPKPGKFSLGPREARSGSRWR